MHRERITFNHRVSQPVKLGPNGPGDATVKLDTVWKICGDIIHAIHQRKRETPICINRNSCVHSVYDIDQLFVRR